MDCFVEISALCLDSGLVQPVLLPAGLQWIAKASKRQSNPCFSHNQEVCPAVSAIELMLGNLQPLSADLQNVVGTTAQRMDWSRPNDSLPFERTVWRAEVPR